MTYSYLGLIEKSKSRWVTKDVFLGLKEVCILHILCMDLCLIHAVILG